MIAFIFAMAELVGIVMMGGLCPRDGHMSNPAMPIWRLIGEHFETEAEFGFVVLPENVLVRNYSQEHHRSEGGLRYNGIKHFRSPCWARACTGHHEIAGSEYVVWLRANGVWSEIDAVLRKIQSFPEKRGSIFEGARGAVSAVPDYVFRDGHPVCAEGFQFNGSLVCIDGKVGPHLSLANLPGVGNGNPSLTQRHEQRQKADDGDKEPRYTDPRHNLRPISHVLLGLQILCAIFLFDVGAYLIYKAIRDPIWGKHLSDIAMFCYGLGGFLCLGAFVFVLVFPSLMQSGGSLYRP